MAYLSSISSTTVRGNPVETSKVVTPPHEMKLAPPAPPVSTTLVKGQPVHLSGQAGGTGVPVVVPGGLANTIVQTEQALAAITPPRDPAPSGNDVAEASSLRQLAAWARAQLQDENQAATAAAQSRTGVSQPVNLRV